MEGDKVGEQREEGNEYSCMARSGSATTLTVTINKARRFPEFSLRYSVLSGYCGCLISANHSMYLHVLTLSGVRQNQVFKITSMCKS